MSRTDIHIDKGKFNNGLLDKIPTALNNMFNRYNGDKGEFRKAKKDLADKIAEKELETELEEIEQEKADCDNPKQDEILLKIMGRV